jgi:hypothetical protein
MTWPFNLMEKMILENVDYFAKYNIINKNNYD